MASAPEMVFERRPAAARFKLKETKVPTSPPNRSPMQNDQIPFGLVAKASKSPSNGRTAFNIYCLCCVWIGGEQIAGASIALEKL